MNRALKLAATISCLATSGMLTASSGLAYAVTGQINAFTLWTLVMAVLFAIGGIVAAS